MIVPDDKARKKLIVRNNVNPSRRSTQNHKHLINQYLDYIYIHILYVYTYIYIYIYICI